MKNHTDFMIQQSFRALDRIALNLDRDCCRHDAELIKMSALYVGAQLFVALTMAWVIVGWFYGQ